MIPFYAMFCLQRRGGDLPEGLAKKLENATVLAGHTGCVNRLAWNQDGSMLASASDDCQVRCLQQQQQQLGRCIRCCMVSSLAHLHQQCICINPAGKGLGSAAACKL